MEGKLPDNSAAVASISEQIDALKETLKELDTELVRVADKRVPIINNIMMFERMITTLENPMEQNIIPVSAQNSPPFSREWVRNHMKYRKLYGLKPAQTKEIVDKFYVNATDEEKEKAIKTLSVVFNNLIKSKEVGMEKKEGIKGNFYKWIGDV